MKNYTKTKKVITICGYALSLIMLIYFFYLMGSFVGEIRLYETEIGKISFSEKFGYIMSNIGALVQAATLALLTKIYTIVAPNKKTEPRPKHAAPERVEPNFYEDYDKPSINGALSKKEKDDVAQAVKKAYEASEKANKPITAVKKPAKTMTLQKAADRLGVSKDRVYRYCKTSGIRDKHEGESPIMITEDEFKSIKKHFDSL